MHITAQRIVIVGIIGLLPMLVYCLMLFGLNTRRRASMIPGSWDCAGPLLATSGFMLAGGPLILAGFDAGWRRMVLKARVTEWRSFTGEGDAMALGLWAFVFVAAVGGAAILITRRRHVTVLYNFDTRHVHSALEFSFNRFGLIWKRLDRGYDLRLMSDDLQAVASPAGAEAKDVTGIQPYAVAELDLLVLPASSNVTLIWRPADSTIRRLVEGELSHVLPNLRAPNNHCVRWLVSAAVTLFAILVALMVFLIYTAIKQRSSLI